MKFFIFLTTVALLISSISSETQTFKNERYRGKSSSSDSNESSNNISREKSSKTTHEITLECDYAMMRHYWGEMYTCVTRNLVTRHHYDYVVNVTGDHLTGKGDKDVECVYVLGQRTPFIPYNITTPFGGKVRALRVEDSGLRYVNRTFRYDGPLEYIHLENNLIVDVPKWSFKNLTELRWLSLRNNRIRYLEGSLLHGMSKLWRFSVSRNNIEVIPSGLFHDTPALREVYFYNNRIRMVGWKLTNWIRELKVASFYGNPCTEIAIYDGVNIAERLTKEFQTKCSVDCRHAEIAKRKSKGELDKYFKRYQKCGGETGNGNESSE